MQELDDIALLRQYTEQNSEEAFAALVTRHVNKVYSVALRHTRNPHQAEEITQAVFVILANKSRHLGKGVVLSGWLYQTARLTAVTFIRSEIRRARREQEAHMQTLLNESESDVWPQIAPLLDAAMAGLSETDRHVVVLRFFDGKSMKEVGTALGGSEDAAKMRLNRAVEKLRLFFTKRGVVLPTAVLTAAISANSVQAAPAVLAKTATAIALTKGGVASGSTLTLVKGVLKLMATSKLKVGIAGVIVLASAVAPLVMQERAQAKLRDQNEAVRQRVDQIAQLQAENEKLSKLAANANSSRPLANDEFRELLKLRGQIGRLRTDVRELTQPQPAVPLSRNDKLASMAGFYSERVSKLKQSLEDNPSEKIPELQFLTGDNWLWLAHKRPTDTEEGLQRAMSTARQMAEENFVDVLEPALKQFADANQGQFPADVSQLKPYFKSPVAEAILQRWMVLPKSNLVPGLRAQLGEDWYITQKAPVNTALDQRILCGLKEVHSFANGPPEFWNLVR